MKWIKNKGIGLCLAVAMMFTVASCNLFELDINQDPNNPTQAALELTLTNVQLECADIFADDLNNMASGFMAHTTGWDDFNMTAATWNIQWNQLYSGPLNDLDRLVKAAEEAGNNPRYLGIGQVLKAYYFSLMVDLWGDIPYFEAFEGDLGSKTPAFDDDAAIYADLISLLDKAIVNLAETSTVAVRGDVIYGGNIARWTSAAKSLKLRLLLQTKGTNANAAADIQALIDAGGLITAAANDFQFRFGKLQAPDDRHPWYRDGYAGGEAGFSYFGHQLMVEMLAKRDFRAPFYFKRQTKNILNPADPTDKQTIPCSQRDDCVYGYLVLSPNATNLVYGKAPADLSTAEEEYLAGFFGRDRADPSGIPNDNPIRTTVGAYPAAGLFDDVPETGGGNKGSGDGIFPMLTSWMVNFYLLEAQVTLGVNAGATDATLLKRAVDQQMAKVIAVGTAADPQANGEVTGWSSYGWPITYKTPTVLSDEIVAGYPVAGSTDAKMQYIMKQSWYANFGNGYEVYNGFRRTGFPADIQEPLELPRQFALRLPYTQDEINLNGNTPTVIYDSPANAVFWDVLKFQF
jgi:hypothetical protein